MKDNLETEIVIKERIKKIFKRPRKNLPNSAAIS